MAKKSTSRSRRPAPGGRANSRASQDKTDRPSIQKPGGISSGSKAKKPVKKKYKPKSAGEFDRAKKAPPKPMTMVTDGSMRLNRYISNSGVCSRREADILIEAGVVSVNDKTITELGVRVMPGDVVKLEGDTLSQETKRYLLLNKPKNFVTSLDETPGKRTVMQLIKNSSREMTFPVWKLDRNTTGLLLFTNDSDLAKKLTHPGHPVRKIYQVTTDHKVQIQHVHALREGVELDDGLAKAVEIDYVGNGEDARQIGLEIKSGKKNLVKRMFEHFGYEVLKLDLVTYAGLTKKDLPRGRWRMLTEQEVGFLKML